MARRSNTLLNPAELELMRILWRLGPATASDVQAALPADRAYTTVSTILRILEKKKAVRSRKEGRGHVYEPVLLREAYEESSLVHLLDSVFDGEAQALVSRLLGSKRVKGNDLDEVKRLLRGQP